MIRRAQAVAAVIAVTAVGCRPPAPPKFGLVAKNTEIHLMLIQEIESGAHAVGTVVPFIATDQVVDASGAIVIEKGAPAYGKVVRSDGPRAGRKSRAKAVRLTLTIDDVAGVNGDKLKISVMRGGLQTSPLDLTRANTRLEGRFPVFDAAWAKPEVRKLFIQLAQFVGTSKNSDLGANPEVPEVLRRLGAEVGLPAIERLAESKDLDEVATLAGGLATGRDDLDGLSRATQNQRSAVIELTQAIGYAEDRLSRSSPGKSIRAFAGTPFTAYAVEDAKVRLPSEK